MPRDLPIEGRELKGVHFALELLGQQNRLLEGIPFDAEHVRPARSGYPSAQGYS